MSCDDNTCGTGGWGGPKPGDPSNNGTLSATPAFGGIDLNWTYPTTNPFAVAFTKVFRGIIPEFMGAIEIKEAVGSNFYYDPVLPPILYYYWIQFVSVNGTHGEPIGPASAIARLSIEKTIEDLTGKIDAGVLAQSLKTEIARIPVIDNRIFGEIEDRIASNVVLANAIAQVQNVSNETLTYVQQEITQRQDGDNALVHSINLLYAQASGNAAAINEEKTIRVSKDEVLAQQINTLAVSMANDVIAAIASEQLARINADGVLAQDILTLTAQNQDNLAAIVQEATVRSTADSATATTIADLYTKTGENKSAIETEATSRTSADGALAQQITTLFTQNSTMSAAIQTEQTARINADGSLTTAISNMRSTIGGDISSAVYQESLTRSSQDATLAQQITSTESVLNGNIAQAETRVNTNITTVNGKVTAIGSLYTAKVTVNGLIGGFGVYNNGATVEAGFDVDTFWIGRTSANKRKPFIVVGSETFIDEAVINKLTFSKLRADDGSFIVQNGKVKANYIEADNIVARQVNVQSGVPGQATSSMTNGLFQVFYPNGGLCLRLGIW